MYSFEVIHFEWDAFGYIWIHLDTFRISLFVSDRLAGSPEFHLNQAWLKGQFISDVSLRLHLIQPVLDPPESSSDRTSSDRCNSAATGDLFNERVQSLESKLISSPKFNSFNNLEELSKLVSLIKGYLIHRSCCTDTSNPLAILQIIRSKLNPKLGFKDSKRTFYVLSLLLCIRDFGTSKLEVKRDHKLWITFAIQTASVQVEATNRENEFSLKRKKGINWQL